MNNDYNAMVYGGNMQQQHPMTSIPREMQISQNASMHQVPVTNQQSDIINLSYHQRDEELPHPDLPQQMGLFPTVSIQQSQIQQHNHILQQQNSQHSASSSSIDVTERVQQTVNISYNMDDVDVNLDVQNNNGDNFVESDITKESKTSEHNKEFTENSQNPIENETLTAMNDSEILGEQQKTKTSEPPMVEENQKKKDSDVDPNQCRVCKAVENLIDIFAIEEDMRICDVIMKICSNIRIHERDYLPHMICLGCLGRLRIAYQFIKDIQTTDSELRSLLKRSRKARKPNDGFVIIDCNEFSESDEDDLQNDDDDYQISNAEEDDDDITSGDLSDDSRKAKSQRKRGPKKSKTKKIKQDLFSTAKRLKRDIVFIEANESSEEKIRKREKCKECGKTFSSKNNLRMHRKNAHTKSIEDAPFKCHVCGRSFKYSINLTSHMQIHKDSYTCDECGRVFATKTDVKKHALNQHKCSLSYECNKCRRLYCSVKRYQKHRENCSDYSSMPSKKKLIKPSKDDVSFSGRDLFKTVAPVTTTYWSDSFSD